MFEDENHLNMADSNNVEIIKEQRSAIKVVESTITRTWKITYLSSSSFSPYFPPKPSTTSNLQNSGIYYKIRRLAIPPIHAFPTLFASFVPFLLVLFFRAMSSAEEVLRCSILKFGMLKGATYILSVLCWCRKLRYRSGLDNDRLSRVNWFLWFLFGRTKKQRKRRNKNERRNEKMCNSDYRCFVEISQVIRKIYIICNKRFITFRCDSAYLVTPWEVIQIVRETVPGW